MIEGYKEERVKDKLVQLQHRKIIYLKRILVGLILLINLTLSSQTIEIVGGLNKNGFYDFVENRGQFSSEYTNDVGYVLRLGVEDVKFVGGNWRFVMSYDKYGGSITAYDGAQGGGFMSNVAIDKSVISLGVFPLNYKFFDQIDFNFGVEVSRLQEESFSGNGWSWLFMEPSVTFDLREKYQRYSSNTYFGLRGRIAYDFKLSERLAISPQYSYYVGLLSESIEFPEETRSMRHYVSIGVQLKIK